MAQLNKIYRCSVCGNIVQVLHEGKGTLVCCGQPMDSLDEKSKDEGMEKHVPIIEINNNQIKVKVGAMEHPMVPEHYIEWIELIIDGKSFREFLKPGDKPEVEFCIKTKEKQENAQKIEAREYCSVHGLWKG
jgi:superoxide reductase